jgi:hypothetical protein
MKENTTKSKTCEILKQDVENSISSLSQMQEVGTSKTMLEKMQRMVERKSQAYKNYCLTK